MNTIESPFDDRREPVFNADPTDLETAPTDLLKTSALDETGDLALYPRQASVEQAP